MRAGRVRDLRPMSAAPESAGNPRTNHQQAVPQGGGPSAPQGEEGARDASPGAPGQRPLRARRRLVVALGLLALVVLVVDQVTKAWAEHALADGRVIPVLGDWLAFRLVYNPGAALSIATGMTWVLTIIVVVVVVAIVRAARRLRSTGWAVALGLLLGGALGNLVDRLLRPPGFARGHVVDFIAYGDWFVGNVADIAIVVAAVLVGLLALRGTGLDGRELADPRPDGASRG